MARRGSRCRCTLEDWPCEHCERRIERRELEALDPPEDFVEQMERSYEKWLDGRAQ